MKKIENSSFYGKSKFFTTMVEDIHFMIGKYELLVVENEMRIHDFVYVRDIYVSNFTGKVLIEVTSLTFNEYYTITLDRVIGKVNVMKENYLKDNIKEWDNE